MSSIRRMFTPLGEGGSGQLASATEVTKLLLVGLTLKLDSLRIKINVVGNI